MTPEQLSAICTSFDKMRSVAPDLGTRFYQRLSADHAEISKVFSSVNMAAQHNRFIGMLHIILLRMQEGRPTADLLKDLGARHYHFGVSDENFQKFGATLIAVFHETLGAEFDEYLHAAWVEAYQQIMALMRSEAGRFEGKNN